MSALPLITPNWPAPGHISAFTTTTAGGVSSGDCSSFNLGTHVGDNPAHVAANRARLQQHVGEAVQLCWLHQTHSDIIENLNHYQGITEADAAVTSQANCACIVMTADCLPVLLCDVLGETVAALHCGWKGLYHDLIGKTLAQYFQGKPVMAWLGPAIAPSSYEVDEALYQRFITNNPVYKSAFAANRPGHYLLDLYAIAGQQLTAAGVAETATSNYKNNLLININLLHWVVDAKVSFFYMASSITS
ncbi:MAG: hypothetical protein CR977_03945 [Gammaproteobacteria bacterium]|nr:MAG: hypothetical protein CR977_03945 [Gammaproteobacteria bacterium]